MTMNALQEVFTIIDMQSRLINLLSNLKEEKPFLLNHLYQLSVQEPLRKLHFYSKTNGKKAILINKQNTMLVLMLFSVSLNMLKHYLVFFIILITIKRATQRKRKSSIFVIELSRSQRKGKNCNILELSDKRIV